MLLPFIVDWLMLHLQFAHTLLICQGYQSGILWDGIIRIMKISLPFLPDIQTGLLLVTQWLWMQWDTSFISLVNVYSLPVVVCLWPWWDNFEEIPMFDISTATPSNLLVANCPLFYFSISLKFFGCNSAQWDLLYIAKPVGTGFDDCVSRPPPSIETPLEVLD